MSEKSHDGGRQGPRCQEQGLATPRRGANVTREGLEISRRIDDLPSKADEGSPSRVVEDLHIERAVMPWEAFCVDARTRCGC